MGRETGASQVMGSKLWGQSQVPELKRFDSDKNKGAAH